MYEKEKRLKESLKMMGVTNFIQWSVCQYLHAIAVSHYSFVFQSWFTQYFIFLMVCFLFLSHCRSEHYLIDHHDYHHNPDQSWKCAGKQRWHRRLCVLDALYHGEYSSIYVAVDDGGAD